MHERKIVPVHYETLVRVFELDGFAVQMKKGDHIVMTKPGSKRPVVKKPVRDVFRSLTSAPI